MAKLTLNTIGSRYGSIDALNDNSDLIETAFENTLSRDGTGPNNMESDLDMDSNDIINVANLSVASLRVNGQPVSPGSINYTGQVKETQTATSGQTVFNLSTVSYAPLTNNLSVYVDGVYQNPTTYTENNSTRITFDAGVHIGAVVDFVVLSLTDLPGTTDASNVTYSPAGSGAVTTTVETKLRETVSVKDFGAVGDGVTDDTVAIQNAIDASDGNVVFPQGDYRTTDTITFPTGQYQNFRVVFQGARVTLDADNRPVLRFGTQANPPLFTGYFAAFGLDVSQAAGRTGNTGIALDNVYGSYFQINNILNTEYGLVLTGANFRGTAYNNIDLGNVFGTQYALQFNSVSSGFANQNIIRGGKIISNPGTTAIFNSGNENTFVGTSIEGTWTTGVEIVNRGGVYINVRTEGTFTTTWDLTAAPSGGFANNFIGCYSDAVTWGTYGPDYPVTQLFQGALSANTQTVNRSHYIGRNTSNTGNPVLEIVDGYTSSGTSRPLRTRSGRAAGVAHEVYVGATKVGSINHNIGGVSFESESNSFFQGFMRFGTFYIWVDNSGVLRIKNGVPTSQTDGTVVGTQT